MLIWALDFGQKSREFIDALLTKVQTPGAYVLHNVAYNADIALYTVDERSWNHVALTLIRDSFNVA